MHINKRKQNQQSTHTQSYIIVYLYSTYVCMVEDDLYLCLCRLVHLLQNSRRHVENQRATTRRQLNKRKTYHHNKDEKKDTGNLQTDSNL